MLLQLVQAGLVGGGAQNKWCSLSVATETLLYISFCFLRFLKLRLNLFYPLIPLSLPPHPSCPFLSASFWLSRHSFLVSFQRLIHCRCRFTGLFCFFKKIKIQIRFQGGGESRGTVPEESVAIELLGLSSFFSPKSFLPLSSGFPVSCVEKSG